MKKIFTLCLSMMLLVGMSVQATPIASGSCGENLTWSLENGVLTIAGSGAMENYLSPSYAPWNAYAKQITAISIPGTVTYIGRCAFSLLQEVLSITVPEGVTEIGESAFDGCRHVTSITLPSTLQTIGNTAFGDQAITSLVIPASVTSIGFGITSGCIHLTSLSVEAGNTVYTSPAGSNAIVNPATHTLLAGTPVTVIPNDITTIGKEAFEGFHNMTSITIPGSVTTLQEEAFNYCIKPRSLYIPASVTSIHATAFNSCRFTSIVVDPANPVYESPNNCNAIIQKGTTNLIKACETTVIPANITTICDNAYNDNDSIRTLVLHNGITTIGKEVFLSCDNLQQITLPENLETIGNSTFSACINLTSIDLPATVTSVGMLCFNGCRNLTSITSRAITPPSAGMMAFNGVNKSIPVYVPAASVNAYKAANEWKNFTNILPIPEDEPEQEVTLSCVDISGVCGDNLNWAINCAHDTLLITGTGAMDNFVSQGTVQNTPWYEYKHTITTVLLPDGITYIGDWAFYEFLALDSITIPEGVTGIGYVALAMCEEMKSVKLPSTLQTLSNMVFYFDKILPTLTIPAAVNSIGFGLTMGCDSLKTLSVEAGNTVYDCRGNCNAVIETSSNTLIAGCHTTVIPNNVTTIGAYAMSMLKSLTDLKLPNSVTRLEDHCLDYNTVRQLNIPSSVTFIAGTAFKGCVFSTINVHPANPRYDSRDNCNAIIETAAHKLALGCMNTIIPDDVTAIGEGAFMGNANLSFIALPAQIQSIERDAFTYLTGFLNMVCYAPVPPVIDSMAFNVKAGGGVGYISPNMAIYVPAESVAAYQAAPYWNKFQNFQPLTGKCVVKSLATHGHATGSGVYNAGQKINANASPEVGYQFLQWSNGSTVKNQRMITITQDTTFRALCVTPEAAQAAQAVSGSSADEIIFRYNAIPNATFYELKVFKNGKLVKTVKLNAQGQVVGTETAAPSRIVARSLEGEGNEIQISLSNMEMGQDYNFSLDSYDMADDLIDAQAGTFNVEQPEPQQQPELACVADSGMCGPNLYWALSCNYDTLLITGSGAMKDYSYSDTVPWNAHKTTITTVLLPQGLTHLGAWSLYQFEALQSIVIPEGVTSLGYVALAACRAMTSVSLPGTLQTIGGGMFSANERLQSLTIPASVTSIGSRLTEECNALTSLVVEEGNTVYDSRNNCNAVIETATDRLVAGCPVTVIPNTVEIIGEQAFSTLRNLTQIKLPTSVTTLEGYCYQYCSNVKVLNLPSSVTNIHGEAFTGCRFYEINVITGNPRYDSRDNCNAIIETATNTLVKGCENTVIPDGIVSIGEGAFMSNFNLQTISLPATVNSIEHNALLYCNNLQSLTCRATVPPAVGPEGFNYGTTAYININPAIPVYVPGPSLAAYQSAPGWSYFTNFVALDSYYSVKALANHGTVTGTGTYAANSTVVLVATPEDGFRFKQWSDGSTEATKTFVVNKDTTLRAFFELVVQEEQTIVAGQTTVVDIPEITITFEPVEDAMFYELKVYMNGNLVATVKIDANGQIAGDIVWAAPSRIQARTVDDDPSVYQVNLSNLEFGKDYTFTLDTYNEEEECISAQSGSFNVPEQETPTCVESVAGKNAQVESVKVMENGILYILRNGVKYDAQGVVVDN